MPRARIAAALLLFTALFTSTGCLNWPGPTSDARVVKLYGGEDGYELIAIPALANVRVYRVEASRDPAATPDDPRSAEPKTIGSATVLAGPVKPGDASLKALSDLLRSTGTYTWDSTKGCKFNPGVAARFIGNDTTIDVLLCFGCKQLAVYKNGKLAGGADFDAKEAELAALAREWFPDLKPQ